MRNSNLTKWLMVAAISLSFGLATRGVAAPNLLVNGDFEQTNLPSGQTDGGPLLNSNGSTAITLPGWTMTGGDGVHMNIYQYTSNFNFGFTPIPQSGNYAVWLDGSQGTGSQQGTDFQPFSVGPKISQSLTLNPGNYNLSFYINTEVGNVAGNQKGGTSGVLVDLFGAGNSISNGALNNAEFTVTNPLGVLQPNAKWQFVTENFTVTTGSLVTLSFQDDPNSLLANQGLSSNISVDNAAITFLSPIPEPSSLALLAVGSMSLFGIQVCRRRRRC
jgi:hypothetical protein